MQITTAEQARSLRATVGKRMDKEFRRHLRRGHNVWFLPNAAAVDTEEGLHPQERAKARAIIAKHGTWAFIFRP